MATTDDPRSKTFRIKKIPRCAGRDGVFRFTSEQFEKLDELGYFEDRHVELVGGVIFEMTSKPAHATSLELTSEALRRAFGQGWYLRHAQVIDLGRRNLPEPDMAVVAGTIRDYADIHPKTAALVVEISETTLRKDRTIKDHVYAWANLPDYWIVNLVERQLEVHRNPGPDPSRRGRFRYENVTIVPESGRIAPLAAAESPSAVADLLP